MRANEIEKGTCPVCNGTLKQPSPKHLISHYGPEMPCRNCGGQYMSGKPTGLVRLNKDGEPCTHEYEARYPFGRHRGITDYTCKHCGDKYTWDSTD